MEFFRVHKEEFVADVAFSRPPANALSSAVLKELSSLLDELEADENVRVVLLHGEGRFFSAGADIKEFTSIKSSEEAVKLAKAGQQVLERIERFTKPVIAAVHGAALGGGLELAMSCHVRIVSENAKLGLPELQLGIIPGFAGTQRLPRYVGFSKAAEMMWTSEPITGTEAVQWGLASKAVPEEQLLEEAKKLAKKIAQKSPISIRATLQLLNAFKEKSFQEAVREEAELFGSVFTTEDAKEGVQAFIEKRPPSFQGK
ncbi:enoyl-CoA hydratase [Parageobacillus thermoglucosidasius]|uniref:enoyl-CoA hydratase n=1 Tax=Parageobacillus thermoglucosidasius TaxID=1426 RepID=UPI000B56B113|nr:enoyl-CoA hydratase [Parageobacillus thermoglucosidasius]MED4903806.1 enoyl-CoA hydratase [Parageobacillus thermoglucosidasius]MED4912524.1 enoyl-CoA hydratase [Parageobacillus thermoglucosidasius]MED4944316.1 enoyl-CoA hydratase [Parageobacillus thermoglucosidasius]MED4981914.1 enoyl-CoA hydratase [Parageobacillus thermoglucosidasius]OUM83969.1 MAG: enoyl-CoA hydratase [Parageobacillus thermoglucosidasius]